MIKTMTIPALLAALLLLPNSILLAQEKPAADATATTPPGKSYSYKTSAGKPRAMEIYFPPNHDATKSKVPGIILFHGGAWSGGTLDTRAPK